MRIRQTQTENLIGRYEIPEIEVIDIETEQNILGGSATTPDMPGEDW